MVVQERDSIVAEQIWQSFMRPEKLAFDEEIFLAMERLEIVQTSARVDN